jgi:hypothetical protein
MRTSSRTALGASRKLYSSDKPVSRRVLAIPV